MGGIFNGWYGWDSNHPKTNIIGYFFDVKYVLISDFLLRNWRLSQATGWGWGPGILSQVHKQILDEMINGSWGEVFWEF